MMDNANSMGLINTPSEDILDMRTDALDLVEHDNAHEVVNNFVLDDSKDATRARNGENLTQTAKGMMKAAERKTQQATKEARQKPPTGVLYEKGLTQPTTPKELAAEAKKDARHSANLERHLKAAGEAKPTDAQKGSLATHHIVAVTDKRARKARALLFRWGIGINDVDNGVRLPRWLSSPKPASLTNATVHAIVHTDRYHSTVHFRLKRVAKKYPKEDTHARVELRGIKQELATDSFPY
jgi:hypothetical protein